MKTVYTALDYLENTKRDLEYWENKLEKLNNNTLEYDGSIPDFCYDALIKSKVKVFTSVVEWLNTLNEDEVMSSVTGLTNLGAEYYERVNK